MEWQLREAFSRKEKIEKFLENLERLRGEGSIDEETYTRLKEEYQGYQQSSRTEIERIKDRLGTILTQTEGKLQDLQKEVKDLEARFKVGQLTDRDYQSRRQRTMRQIEITKRRISALKNQISAQSATEIGGYYDVRIKPAKGVTPPGIQLPEIKLAGVENIITPLRIAGFVVSLLMLIFVFLPWVSVDAAGLQEYGFKALETLNTDVETTKVRDFNVGGIFAIFAGILGMIVSLASARSSSRGWGYLSAGLLGLIGIVVFSGIFANSYQKVLDITEEEWGGELASGISYSPEIGGIFFLIATLAILVISQLEFGQEKR